MAILYPASLANLVVEVGTRHCHQTLLVCCRWERNFTSVFFKLIVLINICSTLRLVWRVPLVVSHLTLVRVVTCCLTAPSHPPNQYWPNSLSPYGPRPHNVKCAKIVAYKTLSSTRVTSGCVCKYCLGIYLNNLIVNEGFCMLYYLPQPRKT